MIFPYYVPVLPAIVTCNKIRITFFIGSCRDTDNGADDKDGDSCSEYESSWCGNYDDDDFNSNRMCCVCGGGSTLGKIILKSIF